MGVGVRQESAANGFNQLNQSPNVVSSAYTSATKRERERERQRASERDRGGLSGHFKHFGVEQTHTDAGHITPAGVKDTFAFSC